MAEHSAGASRPAENDLVGSASSTESDLVGPSEEGTFEPEAKFSSDVEAQIAGIEAQLANNPNDALLLLAMGRLLCRFADKQLRRCPKSKRSKEFSRFMKDNLFVSCAKFQAARDLDRDNLDILIFWGDALVVIAREFELPLFELAVDKYEQVLERSPKSYKALCRIGVCLSSQALQLLELGHNLMAGANNLLGASALDRLAEEKFSKALSIKPDSFQTLVRWANALQLRLTRSYLASDALDLLGDIGSKYHQALTLRPSETWILKTWSRAFDYVFVSFIQTHHIQFNDVHPHLEAFFDVYRHLAEKVEVSLKPIIAFCLVGDDNIDREAFELLRELAGLEPSVAQLPTPAIGGAAPTGEQATNSNHHGKRASSPTKRTNQRKPTNDSQQPRVVHPVVREEALRTAQHIEQLMKSRREQAQNNLKRTIELIKMLPPKAAKEYERSNLSLLDISTNLEIFMNCLYFIVDAETAKDPVFEPQRKTKRISYAAKKKRYTTDDMKRLAKAENPKAHFKHRVPIGSGAFGEVYIAERSDGSKVAIKVIHGTLDSDNVVKCLSEIDYMQQCQHRNIVQFIDCFSWENQVWIVMEYCDGGSLYDLYHEVFLSESEIAYFIQQICQGLSHIHEMGLAHLDIKSENILLNLTGQVRIADFGLVREADPNHPNLVGMVGTSYWMAPEIIRRQPYNQQADIWALGCVCIELAQGSAPYHEQGSLAAMFQNCTRGPPPIPAVAQRHEDGELLPMKATSSKWSLEMLDFLRVVLNRDPTQRPTATQLLEHPFIAGASPNLRELQKKLELVFIGNSLRMNGLL